MNIMQAYFAPPPPQFVVSRRHTNLCLEEEKKAPKPISKPFDKMSRTAQKNHERRIRNTASVIAAINEGYDTIPLMCEAAKLSESTIRTITIALLYDDVISCKKLTANRRVFWVNEK